MAHPGLFDSDARPSVRVECDWLPSQPGRSIDAVDDSQDSASVRLALASVPACVTLVRSMLAGLGEVLGLEPELIDDIKTAVSEACNNVVLHAYPVAPGPLIVELTIASDGLGISVIDRGSGIRQVAPSDDRMGVGLAVISALADKAEFESEAGTGTTVRMSFGARGRQLAAFVPAGAAAAQPRELIGDIMLTVAPLTLLGDVLGRVARAVAASAHFSLDRFADLYLIVDELAAHAQTSALAGSLSCAISSSSGRLELGLGTFLTGALGERLGAGGHAVPLSRLVDELRICPDGEGELLRLLVTDPRGR
ncbi:MAG: ATP-binding protein [Solirubrobacteraceae bacterium]